VSHRTKKRLFLAAPSHVVKDALMANGELGVNGLIARHHVQAAIDLAAATLKSSQALAAKLQLVTEMSSNSAQISRHVFRIQIAKSMNGASGRTAAAIALVLEKGIATSPTLLLERESHVQ